MRTDHNYDVYINIKIIYFYIKWYNKQQWITEILLTSTIKEFQGGKQFKVRVKYLWKENLNF